ncbi:MFS transporter [Methylobacterium isbiliense]|uniref:MFS-type transporter YcaD n=1 Tax=Methylobacterium isbiliense TaxID=315478 RepID=A0ABQ4S9M1_9HYPH|nr:MFS transporter [Methylobacterium isbiliense]MDN3622237.1 MFS transporter [Methylobacterium isbiliense]GJD98472.1 putative MFS-type transporter YcaD [Methylobacterium isbiliense]
MDTTTPTFDRTGIAAIAAAIACVAVVGIGLSLSIPLLSLEMERMGLSNTMIGVNTAIAGVASIVVVPFVPRVAARLGVLPLLLGAIAVGAVSLLGFKALFDVAWWFPLRFVFSAALGVLFVLSEFWINQAAPPARRGLVMGIYATVLALGFAIGPGLLGLLGTRGWTPYAAGAVLFGVGALPLLLARGLSPEIPRKGGRGFLSYLRVAPSATLAALVYGAVETGGFAILPIYGLRLGLTAEQAAGLVSLAALGNVLFQIPVGLLSDHVDRRRLLLAASAVGGLGALMLPLGAGQPVLLGAILFVWGGIAGTLYTVGLAHLGARFTGAALAGANAAFLVLYNIGLVLGPPLVGGGMDLASPHGFAWSLALLFGAYLVVVGLRVVRASPA